MEITVLVENSVLEDRQDLVPEPGLSLYVCLGGHSFLFDTGVADAFARNAARLGLDIADAEAVIVSHHHFDHGGGLGHLPQVNETAPIYLKPAPDGTPAVKMLGLLKRDAGLDEHVVEQQTDRFVYVDHSTEVLPGVTILTEISRSHPMPRGNRYLYLHKGDQWQHDPFDHELVVVIQETDGLVVLSGCSHCGVLNMVETVQEAFPGTEIKALIGGFHLIGMPILKTMAGGRREVQAVGERLAALPVDRYYTGHCTGSRAYPVLKEVLGDRLAPLATGLRIEV
jgi:7,8-dihydropterin-6-yl-methyl-4-(beta-D-ribofuranosyl)aminobenzene 5'-phosphate synthase